MNTYQVFFLAAGSGNEPSKEATEEVVANYFVIESDSYIFYARENNRDPVASFKRSNVFRVLKIGKTQDIPQIEPPQLSHSVPMESKYEEYLTAKFINLLKYSQFGKIYNIQSLTDVVETKFSRKTESFRKIDVDGSTIRTDIKDIKIDMALYDGIFVDFVFNSSDFKSSTISHRCQIQSIDVPARKIFDFVSLIYQMLERHQDSVFFVKDVNLHNKNGELHYEIDYCFIDLEKFVHGHESTIEEDGCMVCSISILREYNDAFTHGTIDHPKGLADLGYYVRSYFKNSPIENFMLLI